MNLFTPWRRLSTRLLLEHPELTVVADTLELPAGGMVEWVRYADIPESAAVVAVNSDGHVLVEHQYSPVLERAVFEFPAGYLKPGEQTVDAAQRELAEEIGATAASLTLLGEYIRDTRRMTARTTVFLARDLTFGDPHPEPTEVIDFAWYSASEIAHLIKTGAVESGTCLAAWALFLAASGRKS